ncbi:MAG: glycosyltransferase [Pseudomonadota bacterium]
MASDRVGAVVIGRNEGARLLACLSSLAPQVRTMIYVDSGSSDGSVKAAEAAGALVVNLDLSKPFTAARARNAGLARLLQDSAPDYVQFVDGDCEVRPDWIAQAAAFLDSHADVAVVHGRRRERFPDATPYNRMCDWEWDRPIGEARACGGDALMRVSALQEMGGYNPALIAGEEPELCVRLRQAGWRIWNTGAEMTLHDAAITRFGQFWKRSERAGHAYAEGAALHGAPPERHGVEGRNRALLWGAALPLSLLVAAVAIHPAALLAGAIYPAQILRVALREQRASQAVGMGVAWQRALFLTISKFAQAKGVLGYYLNRLRGRRSALIEYK